MNILVTGGAGYIGSIVVEQLLERDYQVVVIDNLQRKCLQCLQLKGIFPFFSVLLRVLRDSRATSLTPKTYLSELQ